MKRTNICLFFILMVIYGSYGQYGFQKKKSLSSRKGNLVSEYTDLLNHDSYFLNGVLFSGSYPPGEGHPFFNTRQWLEGQVIMNDKMYGPLQLRYDILNGYLLCYYFSVSGSHVVKMNEEEISRFEIGSSWFINLKDNTDNLKDGYYEEIFDSGFITCYFLHEKYISTQDRAYNYRKKIYVGRNNQFKKIHFRWNILSVMKDEKKAMRKYMRKTGFSVRQSPKRAWKNLMNYYMSLKTTN